MSVKHILIIAAAIFLFGAPFAIDHHVDRLELELKDLRSRVKVLDQRTDKLEEFVEEIKLDQRSNDTDPITQGNVDRGWEVEYSGMASWYDYSLTGFPDYSKDNFTAASRDYKRGTKLKVCSMVGLEEFENTGNLGKCVEVVVNDYGPNMAIHPNRVIDLSSAAFKQLSPLSRGTIPVTVVEVKEDSSGKENKSNGELHALLQRLRQYS